MFQSATKLSSSVVLDFLSYCCQKVTPKCLAFVDQINLIGLIINGISQLTLRKNLLKRKIFYDTNRIKLKRSIKLKKMQK